MKTRAYADEQRAMRSQSQNVLEVWPLAAGAVFLLLCGCHRQIPPRAANATNQINFAKLEKLRAKAQSAEPEMQVKLGVMYARGQGAPQDYVEAAKWFRKAAERGDARAQATL